ncbi:MAG TPA: DUF512 domain-containing protein [Anaerolineales bacterium]|nr:DUF512 domain-containing protein [Anaerolineales bacterium]
MPSGLITSVASGSLAERLGLQPGDELFAINDHPLRDVIDVRFYGAEERLVLRVRRGGREMSFQAQRRYDEPLGLEFVHPTFDVDVRRCNNRCAFCFVSQMPPGLRRSLYIKDDDYRHSFLFGNYITLTNLTEEDWDRIGEQHLSPLYVSVHATDPDLRRRIFGNQNAPDVMAQLARLAGMGIEVHTQIVVVPELNDGPHLDRSIGDLTDLYPGVRSVSIVPVGLTKYHRGGCRVHTLREARAVFEQVTGWQQRLLPRLGVRFAYLSDEWYLRLGEEVPPTEAYDGLDLTENGVGMVRRFLGSEFQVSGFRAGRVNLKPETVTLVTGTLFAPVLRRMTEGMAGVEVMEVANRFFGETVTVAGLLTGRDVIDQLRERELGEVLMFPPAMFGGPEGETLDGMGIEGVERALRNTQHATRDM